MTNAASYAGPRFGFGLYVHWPYCARICPYCDFNVYSARERDTGALLAAMLQDLDGHARLLEEHPALDSIFFGGGTPSLMRPDQVGAIVQRAEDLFGLKAAEITLEANPNDLLTADLAGWRAAGVNRLSIGVQSLDDAALDFLGRDHSAAQATHAVELGLSKFPSVSVDLIYARPNQSLEAWRRELQAAIALGAQHLALYELTIAPKTAFGHAAARGRLEPMPDDAQADLYAATQDVAGASGFPAYEISNHAAEDVFRSRHNMVYWRSGDWIGVGPGAHGRLTRSASRFATRAILKPDQYITQVAKTGTGWDQLDPLNTIDVAREVLAMGLRVADGVELARVEGLAASPVDANVLETLSASGLITIAASRLALSADGRLLADRIAAELSP